MSGAPAPGTRQRPRGSSGRSFTRSRLTKRRSPAAGLPATSLAIWPSGFSRSLLPRSSFEPGPRSASSGTPRSRDCGRIRPPRRWWPKNHAPPESGARTLEAPSVRKPGARKSVGRVPAENIQRVLPGAVAPSQEALTAYWRRIAKHALPYLARRPLTLVRHINGVTFFHEGPLPPAPASVHQLRMRKSGGEEGTRLWVDSLDGLLGLVEIGVVEIHPWGATVDDIDRPDTLVFDLDPGEGVEWSFVVETVLNLRELLRSEGHQPWPKLTGGKGLHVMVPITAQMDWLTAKAYTRRLAEKVAATAPHRYTTAAALAKRPGRVFIDYLRNGRGTTAVGAYSPRARAGFPIAAPVTWEHVEKGRAPNAFTLDRPTPRSKAR